MSEKKPKELLTTGEAAAYLRLGQSTLEKKRMRPGAGPVYLKMFGLVRYPVPELDLWKAACRRRGTWEYRRPLDGRGGGADEGPGNAPWARLRLLDLGRILAALAAGCGYAHPGRTARRRRKWLKSSVRRTLRRR